jgi:hypothetical protein
MQLEVSVHMYGAKVPAESFTLTHFDQAESIGMKVGRVVRDFIRSRPIRKSGTRLQLDVRAIWKDGAGPVVDTGLQLADEVKPKRRRRKKR